MKKEWTEKDIENLIQNSKFPNPAHKDMLRDRLPEEDVLLDLDDLEMAAGGRVVTEPEVWDILPIDRKKDS